MASLLDRLEERSAEAVAVVSALVLLLGVIVVAGEREQVNDRLAAPEPAPATAAPAPPPEPAVVLPLVVPDPVPAVPLTTAARPSPVVTSSRPVSRAPSPTAEPEPERSPDPAPTPGRRVVVLGVEAPSQVRAGQTVTFRVSVSARGGTPVLTAARFGDGTDGGRPAPCAGLAGPSYRGKLEVTHTYAAAGTYTPYFIAALPCGPSSGAGTSITVTAGPTPTAGPSRTPTPSPTGSPP